jgi:DNA-binding CsgD family transcriptional regulator
VSEIASRREQADAVADFLSIATREPVCFLLDGEAGIGKTTAWLDAIESAREEGFLVLSCRPSVAESAVGYACLADLLSTVNATSLSHLPTPQRVAIERVLLRWDDGGPIIEPRAVAAAFLSIIQAVSESTSVIVAIDDVQWVDSSSAFALSFAFRRLTGRISVLGTLRTEVPGYDAAPWLQMERPNAIRRITLPPFTIAETAELLTRRHRRVFSKQAVTQIHDVSRGNPFYAVELGRVMNDAKAVAAEALPNSLSELVGRRIDTLGADVRDLLLAASCMPEPTVDVIAASANLRPEVAARVLEEAENQAIISINGNRVSFSHPLLARGVHDEATPSVRRAMHRRLANVVQQPEVRARHLALSATAADAEVLEALDTGADLARARGAPAAAAELLDLAINLGGAEPEREIRAATHHFDGGNIERAQLLLDGVVKRAGPGPVRAAAANLLASIVVYAEGFASSANLIERFLPDAASDAPLLIQMLMSLAYMLLGAGRTHDSTERAEEAVGHAEQLGWAPLLSRSLSLRVVNDFMCGRGVDHSNLQRAIASDDGSGAGPVPFQPRMQQALLLAWTGELDSASSELRAIERRRIENGDEGESIFVSYHRALVEIWRGNFIEADRIAIDMMGRAAHLERSMHLFAALAIRTAVSAYRGEVDEARRHAQAAEGAAGRSEAREMRTSLLAARGFLEVSLGRYEVASALLRPAVDGLFEDPDYTEIIVAPFVSDAVEAMSQLERFDDADKLVDLMDRNGRRLARPWMLVVAMRGRAMLLAARGELEPAITAARQAMIETDRLAMPFERARTQLLLGQLHRRLRERGSAVATLSEAVQTFESLNTPLWANRARSELALVRIRPHQSVLTTAERRVAELAAQGMTKNVIAAALFVSPKTVDTHLTNIYRKLDIHSRAELARLISPLTQDDS